MGLPVDTQYFTPLMLLVPHLRSQWRNKSVSFAQVSNLIRQLQIVSYFKRRETVLEFNQFYAKERIV